MFEYVVAISLAVLAFVNLWDWIGDRLYEKAISERVEDDE